MALITPIIAFVFLVVGVLGLTKSSIGQSIKGLLGALPGHKPQLYLFILIGIGLVMGGVSGGMALWNDKIAGGAAVASLTGSASSPNELKAVTLNVEGITVTSIGTSSAANITFRADPSDANHYFADVKGSDASANVSINGTLSVPRSNTGDLSKGGAVDCYVASGSYRAENSVSDTNVYYILDSSTSKSIVSGYQWQQTAYLKSGGLASTTDNKEKTNLVFGQDVAQQTLGFSLALTGTNNFAKLNTQSSSDVKIMCDGQEAFKLTVTKLA